ncbi:ATP-grasp fold amidoligase family protein [Streptococcus sp.]|uniref:ATP-grasp fold amidoligase family protein n=1 Tax=Streptococcus sp. TaxID=1306 RepID=UPI002588E6AD|nr:ATP-grasp fold amidoligase family protein [Streptococcus sp.]MCQ2963887.1 glycosyl transferase [Streptococcus sp.]
MSSNKLVKNIRYMLKFLPDRIYIQLNYFARFKKFANLETPKTYNEKINWLKLNVKNPLYTKLVDKYEVKSYVGNIIGSQYIIPTLQVYDDVDSIDFDALPEQFVLKCTHDSEGLVICKDKTSLNIDKAKKKLRRALKQNFFYIGREYPYKNVKPRIIAEPYLEDNIYNELRDYKFFCFNGEPKYMLVISNRMNDVKIDYFDLNFKHLDTRQKYENADQKIEKPINFDKMIELSRTLSKKLGHVRVDFYEVNGKIYFGELTFYHFSGFMPFEPAKWDEIFGEYFNF